MQEALLACQADLERLSSFLLHEESVLIHGDVLAVQALLDERRAQMLRMEVIAEQYQDILSGTFEMPADEETQQCWASIQVLLRGLAYQNRVNQDILERRQARVDKQLNLVRGAFVSCYDATGHYACGPLHRISIHR